MKLTVFSLLGIVFMASCQQNVSKIDEVVMKRDTLITQFSDSSYFSDIRSMYYYRDNIYLTDYQRSQIIKLNKSGEVIKCLSEKGMGPGEMQGASDLFVKEDSIFVINDFKQCLELFSNSKHLKSIMIPSQTRMATGTRFAYYNNTLYLSSASERNSIVAICQHDNTFKHLGKLIDFGSLTKSKIC
ncbi:MAG: hypothetical protein JW702_03935, partial [Clostridiales bacterium]|nr:hypothetical protein [Clostridiales bacterium]